MTEYNKLVNEAELALNKGEYRICINILNSKLELFSPETKEGTNIRFLLITALSGINQNEEAIILCKQLLKSTNKLVKEEARSLIKILNSPNLQTPDNWNITFENEFNYEKIEPKSFKTKSNYPAQKKFINISNEPTGETKTFQQGFIFFTFVLLFCLILILSGCVRINSTIDIRNIESIDLNFDIESKYFNKIPWQLTFENKMRKVFPDEKIISNSNFFSLKEKGLKLNEVNLIFNQILKLNPNNPKDETNYVNINYLEKDYFIGKKYVFNMDIDLTNIENHNDLDLYVNIIYPTKIDIPINQSNTYQISRNNKTISWQLFAGKPNNINFSIWNWNKLLIGFFAVALLVLSAYYIRRIRYEIGPNLPRLPS